jgi:NADPH2:quinone reductase
MLAWRGRVVLVGSRGAIDFVPRDAMTREATIFGTLYYLTTARERARAHRALGAGLSVGLLRPVVGTELPLSEAQAAHVKILEPGARGKIVLIP